MVNPFTDRARAYVRSRATSVMTYECKVERLAAPSYDETTLIASPGTRTTIIEFSVCRVWEVQGASVVNLGETELMVENVQISLPYDTPVLKKHDEIVITNTPTQDDTLLGKRFSVISSARAGELRPTRRYAVKAVE